MKSSLIKGVVIKNKCRKGVIHKPHRLDCSVHKQKKETSVRDKSVESYKVKEVSGLNSRPSFCQDFHAFERILLPVAHPKSHKAMGAIFPFLGEGLVCWVMPGHLPRECSWTQSPLALSPALPTTGGSLPTLFSLSITLNVPRSGYLGP